jgi:hypothetical protein
MPVEIAKVYGHFYPNKKLIETNQQKLVSNIDPKIKELTQA